MSLAIANLPPPSEVYRAEREARSSQGLDAFVERAVRRLVGPARSALCRRREVIEEVACEGRALAGWGEDRLASRAAELRFALRREGLARRHVLAAFALIREVAERTIGLRHFDCQLLGGWAMVQGMVAEMETGEGKTLTATLAACAAAMAGLPVHIVSVNDYLTQRDAEWMGSVYRALGVTVGCVTHEMTPPQRREAYRRDVTYVTNKEVVFDYLRDRMVLKDRADATHLQAEHLYDPEPRATGLVLRGLYFGLVDEADSVLVDEARTPLIIAGRSHAEAVAFVDEAVELAASLVLGSDFEVDETKRKVELTEAGRRALTSRSEGMGLLWQGKRRREENVRRGLEALHLYRRDEHYLVRDGKVQIVDEFTGRLMPDRSWELGLHQMVESKEGSEITAQNETLTRLSYQRFFRRYHHLCGMTGTAREVAGELNAVYGLTVTRIPTNRPLVRANLGDTVYATLDQKWAAVVARVRSVHERGVPLLVGTRSVGASEHLSRLLTDAGLAHRVLNAKSDQEEADIIAQAGGGGRITIATNMAGRGTDIKLADGIAKLGGLHVILTERHEARRIDRQLAGRCGRQGDPGCYEGIYSLEDPVAVASSRSPAGLLARVLPGRSRVWQMAARAALRSGQRKLERTHSRIRRDLLKSDEQRGEMLSFSGLSE